MEDENKWGYACTSPCAFMANTKTTLPFYAIPVKEEALRTAVIRVKLLSTHFVSNLCSLLIEATNAHAPRGHGLRSFGTNEDRRRKNCESETGKASFCTK